MKRSGLLVCLLAGACAHQPLNIESGTTWRLPLVDPLTRAELAVPVMLNGRGPYLFILAPTALSSVIDEDVANEVQDLYPILRAGFVITQRDHTARVGGVQIDRVELGDLRARHVDMLVVEAGLLSTAWHGVVGILGADLLASSLVEDVDRDRGIVQLTVAGHDQRPAGAVAVELHTYYGAVLLQGNKLLAVTLDGRELRLAIDFTAAHTATRGAAEGGEVTRVADQYGTVQDARLRSAPSRLTVDGLASDLRVAEFVDRRVYVDEYDGILGQDFLARSRVVFDPHRGRLWLSARSPDLGANVADRVARWGPEFARCAAAACATVIRAGEVFVVTPAVSGPAVVTLEALDAAGHPLDAPLARVATAGSPATAEVAIEGAASMRVVDVAPRYP